MKNIFYRCKIVFHVGKKPVGELFYFDIQILFKNIYLYILGCKLAGRGYKPQRTSGSSIAMAVGAATLCRYSRVAAGHLLLPRNNTASRSVTTLAGQSCGSGSGAVSRHSFLESKVHTAGASVLLCHTQYVILVHWWA